MYGEDFSIDWAFPGRQDTTAKTVSEIKIEYIRELNRMNSMWAKHQNNLKHSSNPELVSMQFAYNNPSFASDYARIEDQISLYEQLEKEYFSKFKGAVAKAEKKKRKNKPSGNYVVWNNLKKGV